MFNKTDTAKRSDKLISSRTVTENRGKVLSNSAPKTSEKIQNYLGRNFQQISLDTKATILAIAIGTLPGLLLGVMAYFLNHKSITQQITQTQETAVINLSEDINNFLLNRYGDIQVLSNLQFLTDDKISLSTSNRVKQALLNRVVKAYNVYDSIAVYDLQGRLILQSTSEPLSTEKNRKYIQDALGKKAPVISQPDGVNIYVAAQVKNTATDTTIAIIRTRIPLRSLAAVINSPPLNSNYYVLDDSGRIILSSQPELLGQKKLDILTGELVSYKPLKKLPGLPDLNWQIILATNPAVTWEAQRQLLWAIAIGTAITALVGGAIGFLSVQGITQSILKITAALGKLSQGELDTRLETITADELGTLAQNINQIATQLQLLTLEKVQLLEKLDRIRSTTADDFADEPKQKSAILELLDKVESVAKGDLTVRTDITPGEIGIVADFFNSIVESLRGIVTQVKQAATQVNEAIGTNEGAIRQLAEEALIQATEINRTLNAVDEMTNSIQTVADSAQKAALIANHAAQTATKSGQAMDLTVQNILSLRQTVGATAKKVRRLGESTQQISRVVSLINQIAIQTNLLAINASIEATRAGEEGQGFAVVAEEVGELAARSAAATQEIEQIVENIQRETNEVVQAMEIGTTQVVEGTQIVEDAKQNLSQILEVSRQIDALVQSISTATASQVETSQIVSHLMKDIAASSQRTSDSSHRISQSLHQTVEISHQLQETVGTFKVN